jgi:hypothetical protein
MMSAQKKKYEIGAKLNIHHTSQYCTAQQTDTAFQYEQQYTTNYKVLYVSFHLFSNNSACMSILRDNIFSTAYLEFI